MPDGTNVTNWIFALFPVMTFMASLGGLFLKRASSSLDDRDSDDQKGVGHLIGKLLRLLKNRNLYLGVAFYLLSVVINVFVLNFLDLSLVLPLSAFTFIWTIILSYAILKEKITYKKVIGTALILCGAVLVAVF